MGLRAGRRNVVVWRSRHGPGGRYRLTAVPRPASTRRLRRLLRISGLLTAIGLIRLGHQVRLRWRPLLAGGALTAAGVVLRGGAGGLAFIAGFLFLYAALVLPVRQDADGERRLALERELADYSTPAQRQDLEATLDRYPDSDTYELREILARQAVTVRETGIPGIGRPPATLR